MMSTYWFMPSSSPTAAAVGGGDHLDRRARSRRIQPRVHARGDGAVRAQRLAAAAQDGGVARFQAQAGGGRR